MTRRRHLALVPPPSEPRTPPSRRTTLASLVDALPPYPRLLTLDHQPLPANDALVHAWGGHHVLRELHPGVTRRFQRWLTRRAVEAGSGKET